MPYVVIDINRKKEIVRRYWLGDKVSEIARKYNVSRYSVRTWSHMADEAIINILEERGHTDRIEELEKEVKELKEKLESVGKQYNKLSQFSQMIKGFDVFEIEPLICDECGCTTLWKNGKVIRKEDGKPRDGLVQRYTCSNCKANIYIVKKKPK
jgi:transposase-like protein